VIRQQHHPVGLQFVEGAHRFGDRRIDMWHRDEREETEAVRLSRNQFR
jgi:hypothetical protein